MIEEESLITHNSSLITHNTGLQFLTRCRLIKINVMRHGDKINNLSRTASHRRALLSNLACQLIEHKKIVTTLAKAKALRTYVEPLITKAKENTTHQHRVVFSYLQDKEAIQELFGNVAQKIGG